MGLPLDSAAAELGVARSTLRRWIEINGAPVVHRGGRGRVRCTLVDPEAVRAWRRRDGAQDVLQVIAAEIPDLLADAMYEALTLAEGPHKRHLSGALAGAWYVATTALLGRLRDEAPAVPELDAIPDKIERLRAIFGQSCTLQESDRGDDDP